jgi:hypothetical protein
MSFSVKYFNTFYNKGGFHPAKISGTQLYFSKNNASVSSWPDGSPNKFNLRQETAIQQPTISANSVDFDGIDDVLFRNISDPFISDTQGVIFFSFYFTLGVNQNLLASADNATNNFNFRLVAVSANKITLQVMTDSLNNNLITLNTSELVNGYNYGYVGSNGTSYFGSLNGVPQTMLPTLLDDGKWLSSIPNRDNISIGGWLRNTTTGRYTSTKSNKIYYNNTALSSADLAKLETFFSDPNNY